MITFQILSPLLFTWILLNVLIKIPLLDKDDEIHNLYWDNEQKSRKYTKIIESYSILHSSALVAVFFYALFCVAMGRYDTSSWFLPFNLYLPFDETTLLGWFIACIYAFLTSLAYAIPITLLWLHIFVVFTGFKQRFNHFMNDFHLIGRLWGHRAHIIWFFGNSQNVEFDKFQGSSSTVLPAILNLNSINAMKLRTKNMS